MIDVLHVIIPLVSAIVTAIVTILYGESLVTLSIRLVSVTILFYIVGLICRHILRKQIMISEQEQLEEQTGGQELEDNLEQEVLFDEQEFL